MYFYIDESGQTGLDIFKDSNQPFLYYGILSCKTNIDILAKKEVELCRTTLSVERLHAQDLGVGRLTDIVEILLKLIKKRDLRFDFTILNKRDHALISFFDQVFDQGINPAVPWSAYWTPLRYMLLFKVNHLFDINLLKKAWEARKLLNSEKAETILVEICETLLTRLDMLPDQRSHEIIYDSLNWVILNPSKIGYNAPDKAERLQISPNLIGFQCVMHTIAFRLQKFKKHANKVIVDRQTEFNKAQELLSDSYRDMSKIGPYPLGLGLPIMDLSHTPEVPIECMPGTDSYGLEIVDIFTWIFKRQFEKKNLSPELYHAIDKLKIRGHYYEFSLKALDERWGAWFDNLPEPTKDQLEKAQEIIKVQEEQRHRIDYN